jgi:hypothetical protein
MYPEPQRAFVDVEEISEHCAADIARPLSRCRHGGLEALPDITASARVLRRKGLSTTRDSSTPCARPERAVRSGWPSDGART